MPDCRYLRLSWFESTGWLKAGAFGTGLRCEPGVLKRRHMSAILLLQHYFQNLGIGSLVNNVLRHSLFVL